VKVNVITQVKGVGFPIRRYVPTFSDAGNSFQAVIDLDQTVIQRIVHPNRVLVTGKGWIKRTKALIEIDVEDGFFRGGLIGCART